MLSSQLNILKVTVLVLLVSTVSGKSISKRSDTELDNEVEPEVISEQVLKKEPQGTKENVEKTTVQPTTKQKPDLEEITTGRVDHRIDPTVASNTTSNNTRSSRTIPILREVETPATVIENFRNKLKEAHKSLADSLLAARKVAEPPKLFIPSAEKIKPMKPTLSTFAVGRTVEEAPALKPEETKKIITSPMSDDSSSSSEERNNNTGPSKGDTKLRQSEKPEDISHLLHVREEINKIRHMMQALREQQLRQQFGAQFPHSRNLTEEETASLATIIEKLKDQGKISTKPLNPDEEGPVNFQNHPPETTKLIEDVKKLKESVLSFAKTTSGSTGSVQDLEKQIQQQREEIESLKKLVDDLQPPKTFPTNPLMIKHPQNVKSDLHQELRTLQDILNELLKKEEAKEKIKLRSPAQRAAEDGKPKTDEEIGTLMKIFHSISHQTSGTRQSDSIESKLEKLERELKELDNQNQRTRHELLLQKLDHDIKALKSQQDPKEQLKKPPVMSPLAAKISDIENQLKMLNKPESKSTTMDLPTSIGKELDNLQNEIDLMALKNLQKSGGDTMSSRQLESLFTDILTPPAEEHDSSPADTFGKLTGIIKPPSAHLETTKEIAISEHSVAPSKITLEPVKNQYPAQPIFQLPFCLQKYPQLHSYVPQYHSHSPTIHHNPVPLETIPKQPYSSQLPEKTISINHEDVKHKSIRPQEIYGTPVENKKPLKTQGYNNEYQKPIKVEEQPVKTQEYSKQQQTSDQGYNSEYQKPIKNEEQQIYNKEPVKMQEYSNKQQMGTQGYNNEYQKPIKNQESVKVPEYPKQQQTGGSGYNAGYQEPNKQQNAYQNVPKEQIKIDDRPTAYQEPNKQEYSSGYNKEPIKEQQTIDDSPGYNNEEYRPVNVQTIDYNAPSSNGQSSYNKPVEIHNSQPEVKPVIHHIYQPSVPKATPVKIEYQQHPEPDNQQYGYSPDQMVYYKPSCQHQANLDEEINHLNGMIGTLDEKIDYDGQNYDLYRSKDYKPRKKRAIDDDFDKKNIYKDIQKRLDILREAVESSDLQNYPVSAENEIDSDFQRSAYNPDEYQSYDIKFKKKQKFDNLFIKIVKFILHKLEISAPYIVQSLFDGEAFEGDNDNYYGTPYRSRNNFDFARGAQDSYEDAGPFGGLFGNFQGFPGLLGIIPTVLLKLLSNFSSFLTILKRNNFFKNFLFPGALIAAVDGIMAILVWWFSTDENHGLISYRNSTNQQY